MESTLCSYVCSPPILATSNDNRTNEQKSFSTTHFQINAFSTFLGYKILFSGYYYFANPTPYSDETHALDHWALMLHPLTSPVLRTSSHSSCPSPTRWNSKLWNNDWLLFWGLLRQSPHNRSPSQRGMYTSELDLPTLLTFWPSQSSQHPILPHIPAFP